MYVAHISHLKIPFTFILDYLKNLKTILRNSRLLDQFFSRVISTLEQANTQTMSVKRATIITNDQSEFSLCALQRHSFDNELNNHGKRLLEICRSADLTIMNGRSRGYSLGRATFHGSLGVSVVDYAICNQDLFHSIANFVVKEPSSLSDHSPMA